MAVAATAPDRLRPHQPLESRSASRWATEN